MRTFKFRVWDILNKKILNYGEIMDVPLWEVFPGTPEQRPYEVMQYIELRDKNDKEIYEGDIVRLESFTMDNCERNITGKVCFHKGQWVIPHERGYIYLHYVDCEIEVVGNIYENQENNN